MHFLSFFLPSLLLLTSTWLLPTFAAPPILGPPTTSSLQMASNDYTDPYHLAPLRGSSISLILSGFLRPMHPFEPLMLFDIAAKAQFEIVKGVVDSRGDAVIAQPNFQWCSNHGRKPVCLRVNHTLESGFRWSELSQAVKAVVEFGWSVTFVTVQKISVLKGSEVLANAELVFAER
ncbi:MAG: hypothetical protein Q9184_005250 [Pyrenodesmia sp. 2 TL-2023]